MDLVHQFIKDIIFIERMKTLIKARTMQRRFLLKLRMGLITVITRTFFFHLIKISIKINI